MKKILIAGAAVLSMAGAATGASATSVLFANFDAEYGGQSVLNAPVLANFTVSGGTIDIIKSGDYGITCAGGSGSCLDTDGSTNSAGIIATSQSFNFAAGETVTFSFDLSGNQRGGLGYGTDNFEAGFNFGGNTLLQSYFIGGSFGSATPFTNINTTMVSSSTSINPFAGFSNYSVGFVAGQSGSVTAFFHALSGDNVGPILDNVNLDISGAPTGGVPEPAAWALMLMGFGGIGAMVRRRRSLALAA